MYTTRLHGIDLKTRGTWMRTLMTRRSYMKTRNTVSNAHKMIPPAPPCFVWQSPCFALGNPKIIRIKT